MSNENDSDNYNTLVGCIYWRLTSPRAGQHKTKCHPFSTEILWLLAFSGGKQPEFSVYCIRTNTLYTLIQSNRMSKVYCTIGNNYSNIDSPWYYLRGWLGVKQQLSIYLQQYIVLYCIVFWAGLLPTNWSGTKHYSLTADSCLRVRSLCVPVSPDPGEIRVILIG